MRVRALPRSLSSAMLILGISGASQLLCGRRLGTLILGLTVPEPALMTRAWRCDAYLAAQHRQRRQRDIFQAGIGLALPLTILRKNSGVPHAPCLVRPSLWARSGFRHALGSAGVLAILGFARG